MCGFSPRMRLRRSSSNPVITDSTIVSTITPSRTLSVEITVMTETKFSRRRDWR
jgi:hypothetical protein